MRRLILIAFMLLLAASCGGGGVRSAPTPLSLGGFTLADTDLMGSGKLVAEVVGTVSAPEVVVKAEGAEGLKAVYVTMKHPEGYHPVEVEFGGFLGAKEEVISLAVTGRHGEVPCGIIKVHPDEVEGVSGSGEVLRVKYEAGADAAAKAVSGAPGGDENKPTDLRLIETATAGTYILRWHERNVGDYDNSGAVSISDLTPLAMNFGAAVADENSALGLVDGDGSETIGIADVTPIAVHFGTELEGYNVYVAGNMTPLPNEDNASDPLSVMRPDDPGSTRVEYEYTAVVLGGTEEVTVATSDGSAEGVVSDPATLAQPEVPNPPANLAANANQAIGPGRILLSWSPNSEPDLAEYRLYRKAEGETEFTQIAAVPKGTVPLQYTDTNDGDWLAPGIEYTYQATAVNTGSAESDPSNEAANTPFFPAPPTTPATIATESEGIPYSYSIQVTWGASTSDYLEGYEVWRQGPADVDFSLLRTTDTSSRTIYDSGLSEGETYIYKVRAKDSWGQFSDFSPEDSNTPSTYVPMEIYSVTTDNTTLTIGSTSEKAHLEIDLSNPAAAITWTVPAGKGTLDDPTSLTPTYSPPTSGAPAKVTITVEADDGMDVLSDSVDVILTQLSILGSSIDFSRPSWAAPSSPYKPFYDWVADENVILLNFGGYW